MTENRDSSTDSNQDSGDTLNNVCHGRGIDICLGMVGEQDKKTGEEVSKF